MLRALLEPASLALISSPSDTRTERRREGMRKRHLSTRALKFDVRAHSAQNERNTPPTRAYLSGKDNLNIETYC